MEVTDKKALIAEIAGAVLEAMYYSNVISPPDLYTYGGSYSEAAQREYNELHDVVEQTVNSYILNEELAQ